MDDTEENQLDGLEPVLSTNPPNSPLRRTVIEEFRVLDKGKE